MKGGVRIDFPGEESRTQRAEWNEANPQFLARRQRFGAQLQPVLVVSPDTVLRWHRERVRRKWTFRRKASAGRPKIRVEVEALVLQLAPENARWGYDRIEGVMVKLGYTIDRSSIRNLLKCHRVPPAPQRQPKSTWRTFLRHYQNQMLACDFFTVETLWLKTV